MLGKKRLERFGFSSYPVKVAQTIVKASWDDGEEKAKLIQKKNNERVRFQWLNDDEDADQIYFEFKIQVDEITKDVSLIISDFSDEDELEESKMLWENLVASLKQVLGSS